MRLVFTWVAMVAAREFRNLDPAPCERPPEPNA